MIELLYAAFRGAVGAMAMTGVRVFADHADLIRESPPSRLSRKHGGGLMKAVPRRRRRMTVELVHWTMGSAFGVVFRLLPDGLRRRAWAGPVYGLLMWLGFDSLLAPVLGLTSRGWPRGRERAVFLADHALYGLVLSEMRSHPQE